MNTTLLKRILAKLIDWMVRNAPLPPDSVFHPIRLLTLISSETVIDFKGIRMNLDMTGSNDRGRFIQLKRGDRNSVDIRVISYIQSKVLSGTTIDMGAHSGFYALAAGIAVGDKGRVIALEPVHQHFSRLINNVSLNRLTNMTCLNAAVSDKDGVVSMFLEERIGNTGSARISVDSESPANLIYAKSISMSTLMSDLSIDEIEFIKMDIQGAEWFVLPSIEQELRTGFIKSMYLELHIPQIKQMNGDHVQLLELLFDTGQISQFTDEEDELVSVGKLAELELTSNKDEYHMMWITSAGQISDAINRT